MARRNTGRPRTASDQLSEQAVKDARNSAGRYPDGAGLALIVKISGSAGSWLFRYMLNGRSREMGLGSADLVSLTEARAKAKDARRLLAGNIDPIEARESAMAYGRANGGFEFDTDAPPDETDAEIAEEFVTKAKTCGVYFLFDGSALTYIGQSMNVPARIRKHTQNGRSFDSFCAMYVPEDRMRNIEKALISSLRPPGNRAANPDQARQPVSLQ